MITDLRLVSCILTLYDALHEEMDCTLKLYSDQYITISSEVSTSLKIPLEDIDMSIDKIKSQLNSLRDFFRDTKVVDCHSLYEEKLQEGSDFYSEQLEKLEQAENCWGKGFTEKKMEYILCLFQKKLSKKLDKYKFSHEERINIYREKLLKLYLELTGYPCERKTINTQEEKEILRDMRKLHSQKKQDPSMEAQLKLYRTSLIEMWGERNTHFKAIIEHYRSSVEKSSNDQEDLLFSNAETAEDFEDSVLTTEQFELVLSYTLERLNSEKTKMVGIDISRTQDLIRKYQNFREKRLVVYKNQALLKEFFVNVIQNIIWDYQYLYQHTDSTIKPLIFRYGCLFDIVSSKEIPLASLHEDPLMVAHLSLKLYKQIEESKEFDLDPLPDKKHLAVIKETLLANYPRSTAEVLFFTNLIVSNIPTHNLTYIQSYSNFLECLKTLSKSSSLVLSAESMSFIKKYIPNVTQADGAIETRISKLQDLYTQLSQETSEYSKSLLAISDSLNSYTEKLTEFSDLDTAELESLASQFTSTASSYSAIEFPSLLAPEPPQSGISYSTTTIKSLNSIFRFYSNQTNNSQPKRLDYLSFDQFLLFCRDFSLVCTDRTQPGISQETIEQIFASCSNAKTSIHDFNFISLLEYFSEFYFDKNYDLFHGTTYCSLPKDNKKKLLLQELGCYDNYSFHARMKGNTKGPLEQLKQLKKALTSPRTSIDSKESTNLFKRPHIRRKEPLSEPLSPKNSSLFTIKTSKTSLTALKRYKSIEITSKRKPFDSPIIK